MMLSCLLCMLWALDASAEASSEAGVTGYAADSFVPPEFTARLRQALHGQVRLPEDTVVLNMCDRNLMHYLSPWHRRMLQLRPSGYSHAVVAMDTETLQYCAEQRPPLRCALWFPPPLAGAQTPVRTRPDIGLVKFAATLALLEMGHAVLFSEMDVFWVRDPLPRGRP